jgi:hypothetical protein
VLGDPRGPLHAYAIATRLEQIFCPSSFTVRKKCEASDE